MSMKPSANGHAKWTRFPILPPEPEPTIADKLLAKVGPKTENQLLYMRTIAHNKITWAIGPAGSGKTHVAVGMAARYLAREKVGRIILLRPAVGCGPTLGYLPGTLEEKMNPYLRPLFDELHVFFSHRDVTSFLRDGILEIACFEYLQGRTLRNSVVILDEAQNCEEKELRMFIKRFGEGSKFIINGDPGQSTLPEHLQGGLMNVIDMCRDDEEVGTVELTVVDCVRDPLVARMVARGV